VSCFMRGDSTAHLPSRFQHAARLPIGTVATPEQDRSHATVSGVSENDSQFPSSPVMVASEPAEIRTPWRPFTALPQASASASLHARCRSSLAFRSRRPPWPPPPPDTEPLQRGSFDKHRRTFQDVIGTDAREREQRHGLILSQGAKELRVDHLLLHRGP